MGKVALQFGLACGLVAFSAFLFIYWRGKDPLGEARLAADLVVALLFTVASVWYFKRTVGRGWLHFWQGCTVGFLTNLIGALTTAGLVWVFITYVDTAVLPRNLRALETMLLARKADYVALAGEQNFAEQLRLTRVTTPATIFWSEVGKKVLLIGLFPVLVVSIALRRQSYSLFNPDGEPRQP